MTVSPAQLRRHFLPWDRPLPGQAVDFLATGWRGDGPLDLGDVLVVVPTQQSGRRLREGLAAFAAKRGQAVFRPRVMQPEQLLDPAGDDREAATSLQLTLAWTQVLRRIALDDFRAVFPRDPPARDFAWALRLAQEMTRLQATLGEAGLGLEDVATRVSPGFPERERWLQLGELGRAHTALLTEHGWRDRLAERRAAVGAPAPLDGIARIVVLAVPDPLPLALEALAAYARRMPVDLVVFAPDTEAANFDEWGRPQAEAWQRSAAPMADFATEVHLLADATAQAEWIATLAAAYTEPDGRVGIGIVDAEIAALAENALDRAGRPAFNPAGELQRAHGFFHFLKALAAFGCEPSFENTLTLARAPETLDWLARESGGDFSTTGWLQELDRLQAKHLPATLAQARDHANPTAVSGLARLEELHSGLHQDGFTDAVAKTLARMFAGRRLDLARPADRQFEEAASAWSAMLRTCDDAARSFPEVAQDEWWELALGQFGAGRTETDKPAGALELQGWLELLWEDAPHLVVAGFNEGRVPESVVGDVFLPESLRRELGLKSNAARFARDAYLLHALVASRRGGGRTDVLLGKVSSSGDVLKPSRLLLAGSDDELPARVRHLFRPLAGGAALPAWERPWQLVPRREAAPPALSVTALRSYLECPFRFYLRHVLKLEAVAAGKREMDALDFGALCHKPLERLAAAPWRDCTDDRLLGSMLVEELDRVAAARFGPTPAVPVVAQLESARQRLRWAARVQAQQRAAGWAIAASERDFKIAIGGLEIKGRIDRIDRHESTGAWRVVDYKTGEIAQTPAEAHLGTPWDIAPGWARRAPDGRARQWLDLQLPLYVHALPLLLPEATCRPACGYFNLPKAASAAALVMWDDYDTELHASALHCAENLAAAVRAGRFWPPNEELRPECDEFAALFQRGVAASIAWEEPA